jgi:hypothetical protein
MKPRLIHDAVTRAIMRATRKPEDGIPTDLVVHHWGLHLKQLLRGWKKSEDEHLPDLVVEAHAMAGHKALADYERELAGSIKKLLTERREEQFAFFDTTIAFDPNDPGLRKFYADLVAFQARKAIKVLRAMGDKAHGMADRVEQVFDAHPDWETDKAHWTMAQIVGLADPPT